MGLGPQFDKHGGEKGLSTHTDSLPLSSFIYEILKTLIRESLILSSVFYWSDTEPERLGLQAPRYLIGASLLLKQVEVGHELQLGTGTGCSQLEVWVPASQSGGSHGNGNATSFLRPET